MCIWKWLCKDYINVYLEVVWLGLCKCVFGSGFVRIM